MRSVPIFFLVLLSFILIASTVFAQTKNNFPGLSVSPSIIRLDLSTDKPETILTYKNSGKTIIELTFSAQDFTYLEEGGRVRFLEEKDAKNYQYSLSSWIGFEKESLSIAPNETKQLKVLIDKKRLTLGGHYASILAEISQKNGNSKQIGIRSILSSLIFVRAGSGYETEEASLSAYGLLRDWFLFPNQFFIRFKNSGNVELIPHGVVEIRDPFGRLVARAILNEGSLITLPESIRRYDIEIKTLEKFYLPGFYRADLTLHFGKTEKEIKSNINFFILGSSDFIKITLAFLILFIILIKLLRHKRSN